MLPDTTIQRMDNVAIVADDLDAAIAFFAELGNPSWRGRVL
jgi:catechol 2,3-dioxygenase-like lactoylglutathione lyase family enzyme